MTYIPCDWPINGIFGPETFVNHPGAIPQSAAPEAEPEGVNKYAEALHQWAESQRNTMTAKQLGLVRELRLYHTPSLFMEAAAELERLWLENAHQREQLALERGRVEVQMANVAELRREIAENEKSLQYYMERDHGGSLR